MTGLEQGLTKGHMQNNVKFRFLFLIKNFKNYITLKVESKTVVALDLGGSDDKRADTLGDNRYYLGQWLMDIALVVVMVSWRYAYIKLYHSAYQHICSLLYVKYT